MTTDEPGVIHSGEIWLKSQCLTQEEQLVSDIYTCLKKHNYQNINPVSHTRSSWQRGDQKIVVSMVDDLWDCATDKSQDIPYLFDRDTTVITDNFLNCPTIYRIYRSPPSFYGIYSYIPGNQDWTPDRDYTFAVNRLGYKRMQVLLQLYQTLGFDNGYINFNCQIGGKHMAPLDTRRQAFIDEAVAHSATDRERDAFINLANQVPIKNHNLEHDSTYSQSWLNVIVETYSSDNVISMSEKIFRCLVTPVPWVAYTGRYTIAKLRELGFDVMDDIVDHSYDRLLEAQHKMSHFVNLARHTITQLKTQNWPQIKSRAQVAAFQNQELLANLSRVWSENQHTWLAQLSRDIR
jgi:hypothetical protein